MEEGVLKLKITANWREYPYEKGYPASITLQQFKEKLQLVVGLSSEFMRTELRDDDGKFICALTDERATLEQLGVRDASFSGMEIHILNSGQGEAMDYDHAEQYPKYTLSDEKYNERKDSVRNWKRREVLGKSNADVPAYETFQVGDRCIVRLPNQPIKKGFVSYVGYTKFKPGYWIGVTYDEALGKNDGSVDGERYFTCKINHGAFVRPQTVEKYEESEQMEEI